MSSSVPVKTCALVVPKSVMGSQTAQMPVMNELRAVEISTVSSNQLHAFLVMPTTPMYIYFIKQFHPSTVELKPCRSTCKQNLKRLWMYELNDHVVVFAFC